MTTELVHLAVADGIATITLDSPHNRNALSRQLTSELWAHLQTALGDDSVRIIVQMAIIASLGGLLASALWLRRR